MVSHVLEYNEIYDSIVTEFQLCDSILKETIVTVETLTKARMDILKILKITQFKDEILDKNEKQAIASMNINKLNIKDLEKKQMGLKDIIIIKKQEIKDIKIQINKLEHKLTQEKLESRKYRDALLIFLSREKFIIIKKLLIRRYRSVFLKYPDQVSIKTRIVECNGRKEKFQEKNNTLIILCRHAIRKYIW